MDVNSASRLSVLEDLPQIIVAGFGRILPDVGCMLHREQLIRGLKIKVCIELHLRATGCHLPYGGSVVYHHHIIS